jgi:Sulfatase
MSDDQERARETLDVPSLIGSHDVLFVTLDSLRHDVAVDALDRGETPNIARLLPHGKWEHRHSPGTFTYAAHHAFFAGFLPTPATPGPHTRLFAARFAGSETTTGTTCVFDTPDIVTGLAARGYHTICIGGVGFFNRQTPLGCVLPDLFMESHWDETLGVTSVTSTGRQVDLACARLAAMPASQRVFLFINVSAIHQPNRHYIDGATGDSKETMRAALVYVDGQMPRLIDALARRAPTLAILCSDHGTAYGEDGFNGHRLAHPVVTDVPYAEFIVQRRGHV